MIKTKTVLAKDATLRDMFAGQIAMGLLACDYGDYEHKPLAEIAYKRADEMLAEKNKK